MTCSSTTWIESNADKPTIYAFLTLQLLGGFGMLVILLTAIISSKVKRRSTWYSFCFSWIISSISYGLLLLAGQQFNCMPSFSLCLVQTALIYAAPVLTSATTLSLAVHMLLNFEFITSETPFDTNNVSLLLLLILPYCIWLVLMVGVICYGLENPKTPERLSSQPYCSSSTATWSKITFVVVGILSVVLISIQMMLIVKTYKSRRVLRNACGHSYAMLLRIMVFIVLGSLMLSAAAGFTFAQSNKRAPFDLILSLFPVLAAIVFGSQTDILKSWKFWDARSEELSRRFSAKEPYSSIPLVDMYGRENWGFEHRNRQYTVGEEQPFFQPVHFRDNSM